MVWPGAREPEEIISGVEALSSVMRWPKEGREMSRGSGPRPRPMLEECCWVLTLRKVDAGRMWFGEGTARICLLRSAGIVFP